MNSKIKSGCSFLKKTMLAIILISLSLASFSQKGVVIEDLFPFQGDHVHGSSIVEMPNGDLLIGWFQGSGERWADDVQIMGSRKKVGSKEWSKPFLLADVKEFPDCNPVLFIDTKNRLWLMWITILANQWETSLIKYRISSNYQKMSGAPLWEWQDDLLVKAGDKTERGILPGDSFVQSVKEQLEDYGNYAKSLQNENINSRWNSYVERTLAKAKGEDMIREGRIYTDDTAFKKVNLGYPQFRRLGWQTRNKPVFTKSGRMILPLYSDGFGFSLMAFTDDLGGSWQFSKPLIGVGNIQPAIAETKSGELVTYMRDNGPAPKRLHISSSADNGKSWSPVRNSDIPNPGSAADIVTLKNGNWILIYNDQERGRYNLSVALSEDYGKTWPWHRKIEDGQNPTQAHYPAIVEGKNGQLHISYSYFSEKGKNIKYASFGPGWIKNK